MKPLNFILYRKTKCQEVPDNIKTGQAAAMYRAKLGLTGKAVAENFNPPVAFQFVSGMERGRENWNEGWIAKYKAACEKAVKGKK